MSTLPLLKALIPLLLVSNASATAKHTIPTETFGENASVEAMTASGIVLQKEISIDLGQQIMFMLEDGIPVRMFPISSGKTITPTPVGLFQVHRKQELRISRQVVPYRMPYYLSFTKSGSHGMHALPYLGVSPASSWYWSEALDHIGTPVSHGCVRLLPEDALALYEWAEVGIPVTISTTTVLGDYMRTKIEAVHASGALLREETNAIQEEY